MVASSVTSPLCTWLVAACMSLSCERDHFPKSPSMFQCSRKLSWSVKRRRAVKMCCGGAWVSSFYGSGIRNWFNSYLAFEPSKDYNNAKGLVSTLTSFTGEPFSLFGYKAEPVSRRQRRMATATHSGN